MNRTRKVLCVIMACVVMLFATACGKDNTPFKHGTWSGNTYSSDFFGLKMQFGSEWNTFSDADVAKLNNISSMSESSIQTVFDRGGSVYEMMAAKNNGSSINITIQDADKSISWSEKDFFNVGTSLIKSQYEAQGFNCSVEKSAVNFLGKNADCLDISLSNGSQTLYCIMIPMFKSHYTACILFGSLSKPELYTLVNMATPI